MKEKLRPLSTRVLMRALDAESVSPGGIVIPDNAKDKPTRGEVLAVGPGRLLDDGTRVPIGFGAGAVVIYGRYSGAEVQVGGEKLRVIDESDVLGVVE